MQNLAVSISVRKNLKAQLLMSPIIIPILKIMICIDVLKFEELQKYLLKNFEYRINKGKWKRLYSNT